MYKSFEDFEKMYGINNTNDEKIGNETMSSGFSKSDENDELYNELTPTSTCEIGNTAEFEASIFEQILGNKPSNKTVKQDVDFEDTMEIDTFKLDEEINAILEPKEIEKKKTKKKKWLPMTVAKDHHLEYAFAHCAILAFITAAMGTGFLAYIINHI